MRAHSIRVWFLLEAPAHEVQSTFANPLSTSLVMTNGSPYSESRIEGLYKTKVNNLQQPQIKVVFLGFRSYFFSPTCTLLQITTKMWSHLSRETPAFRKLHKGLSAFFSSASDALCFGIPEDHKRGAAKQIGPLWFAAGMQVSQVGGVPTLQCVNRGRDREKREERQSLKFTLAVLQQVSLTESCQAERFKKLRGQVGASLRCQECWDGLEGWIRGTASTAYVRSCAGHFTLFHLILLDNSEKLALFLPLCEWGKGSSGRRCNHTKTRLVADWQ